MNTSIVRFAQKGAYTLISKDNMMKIGFGFAVALLPFADRLLDTINNAIDKGAQVNCQVGSSNGVFFKFSINECESISQSS